MGAPPELVCKVPTVNLEEDVPMRPDEDVYGITYDQIEDYIEGKPVGHSAAATIVCAYQRATHKRELPVTPIL